MAKINCEEAAKQIVEVIGGAENVKTITHCMTRLRFTLEDFSKVDMDQLKKVKGVYGASQSMSGELHIIMNENMLTTYGILLKKFDFHETVHINENKAEDKKIAKKGGIGGIGRAILDYVSASVSPLIPGFVAGGMGKVILVLLSLAIEGFDKSQTYMILSWIADAPFYFMPVFVAYGGARKLNATPAYAMVVAVALLTPAWATAVNAGESFMLFGAIPVGLVSYSSSMFPALLCTVVAAHLERFFNKIIPGVLRTSLVGVLTIFTTGCLAFTILGPIGAYIGSFIANIFMNLQGVSWLAIAILAAASPWLLVTGMAHSFVPFILQNIEQIGYDPILRPGFLLHNMAEAGATLGVALRAKNPEFKAMVFSISAGVFLSGVTEPAIYGVTLKLRRPMIAVMVGGAAGGIVTGLLGVKAYQYGFANLFGLPIFAETVLNMIIGIIVTVVVSGVLAFVLGFDEDEAAA